MPLYRSRPVTTTYVQALHTADGVITLPSDKRGKTLSETSTTLTPQEFDEKYELARKASTKKEEPAT